MIRTHQAQCPDTSIVASAEQKGDTISAMADWKKISDGLHTGIPDSQIESVRPTLDALEKAFQPLLLTLHPEDDTATPFLPDIEESR
jgi:hypothetical protein